METEGKQTFGTWGTGLHGPAFQRPSDYYEFLQRCKIRARKSIYSLYTIWTNRFQFNYVKPTQLNFVDQDVMNKQDNILECEMRQDCKD